MNTAYLSIGSNIGDRLQFLKDAVEKVAAHSDIQVERVSDIYETDPVGYTDQAAFLNIAVKLNRQWVMGYAEQHGIPVHSGYFPQQQVEQADEVWIVNAVQEIVPIRAVESNHFPGNNGEMYQRIHHAYVEAIEAEERRQHD